MAKEFRSYFKEGMPKKKEKKPLKRTALKKKFNPSGEKEIFADIAEKREWFCFVTDEKLWELTPTQFMHVLPKALNKYPKYKHYEPNIVLVTNEVHYKWDFTPRSELRKDPRFDKLFELEEHLKSIYPKLL